MVGGDHVFSDALLLIENHLRLSYPRGSSHFLHKIRILSRSLERIREDYGVKMEQKRDFMSHVLGVFTIFMAPMAVMTSYWVSLLIFTRSGVNYLGNELR